MSVTPVEVKLNEWQEHESDTKGNEKTPIADCEQPTISKVLILRS